MKDRTIMIFFCIALILSFPVFIIRWYITGKDNWYLSRQAEKYADKVFSNQKK